VAEFVSGDVVVVPFPFTDLQASKRRPAVVLAKFARGDLLICQITSRSESHSTAVAINAAVSCRVESIDQVWLFRTGSSLSMKRSSCGLRARSRHPSWLSLWNACVL
jgi:hypothetical protein